VEDRFSKHFTELLESTATNPLLSIVTAPTPIKSFSPTRERLPSHLRVNGVADGSVVALSMRKEYSYIYAILGCLLNGNSFLPIDTSYPTDRKDYMIEDAGAATAVVNFDMCNAISKLNGSWIRDISKPKER